MMEFGTTELLEAMTRVVVLTEHGRHAEYNSFAVPRIGEAMTLRNYPPKRHIDPGETEYATLTVTAVTWERNPTAVYRGEARMVATVRVDLPST